MVPLGAPFTLAGTEPWVSPKKGSELVPSTPTPAFSTAPRWAEGSTPTAYVNPANASRDQRPSFLHLETSKETSGTLLVPPTTIQPLPRPHPQ